MGVGWYSQWDKSVQIASGGQRTLVTRGDGSELLFRKSADGTWQSQTDASFRLVEYANPLPELRWTLTGPNSVEFFDARGRLRSIASPGEHYRLSYSSIDRLESVTDFRGRTLGFKYDAAGYVSQTSDSVTGTTTFAYEDGLMVAAHYPNGQWREFSYDKVNRVTYRDHKEDPSGKSSMSRGAALEDALVSDTVARGRAVAGFEKQSCPVPPPDPCTSAMRYEISVCIMAAEDRRNWRNTVECWPLVRSHDGRSPEEIVYYEFLYNSCITSSEYTYLVEREACKARYPQCG
jgi:YD repeat-containing protein